MDLFLRHLQNAKLFLEYLKYSGLSSSYDEISDIASYENYQRLLKKIEVFDKVPPQDKFMYVPSSTVFDVSMCFLKDIFGSIIDQHLIDDLTTRVLISDNDNVYNGALVYETDPTNKKLLFDRLDTTTSIPVFTHEVTHFLYDETPIFSNIHTTDILAILSELIAADYIEGTKIDDITKYATYVARIKDLKDTYEIMTIHFPQYKKLIFDEFALNMIKLFAEHTTYKYTYSFMVAYNLFLYYKEDHNRFILNLHRLVSDNNAISTMLDYYNINLKSNECTDNTINLINSL